MSELDPRATHPSMFVNSHRTPNRFFTPTHVHFSDQSTQQPASEWQSRRARKGRYAKKSSNVDWSANRELQLVEGRVKRVESELKPGLRADISFWVAVAFTFGSAVWVVNGYLVFFPIMRPGLDTDAVTNSAAATAFIGGTVFEIGSYLMVVEALDRGRETTFGTALGELLHYRRHLSSGSDDSVTKRRSPSPTGDKPSPQDKVTGKKGYIWWGKPMWHDLGYMAALIQLFAATIFWISTLTGLPGVISSGDSTAITNVFFWTPQVVGGCGFIASSLILMIEVQHKWYLPNFSDIGWHVGFWNLIGAFGFMLCGAFGYSPSSGMVYQSAVSTFWGSWAFLIGSAFQVWEVIWREPPEKAE